MRPLQPGTGPGTWEHWKGRCVRITCPLCARSCLIEQTVGADGSVYPRVVCPTPQCGYEGDVVLAGWTPK